MIKKLFIALYIILSLFIASYAGEQVTSYDESTIPVLNEQLRKLSDGIIKVGEPKDLTSSVIIENRTNDTGCTETGRIWLRTDL